MKQLKINIKKHVILSYPMKNKHYVEYILNSKIITVVNQFFINNDLIIDYDFINGMSDGAIEFWFNGCVSDDEIKKILNPLLKELAKEKYKDK